MKYKISKKPKRRKEQSLADLRKPNHLGDATTRCEFPARALGLFPEQITEGALYVIDHLQKAGFHGELVGGCVRDLLLGHQPKDFDVVTNALPQDICAVFSRSRIIGRRFPLVHVRVGQEIIEVSTYRTTPSASGITTSAFALDRKIVRDDTFGTRHQDVKRRDFSINALYYDPTREVVIDYINSLLDIEMRLLRPVEDPIQSFSEDPIRMIRAIRFSARLNINMDQSVVAAIVKSAPQLCYVSPARLFDEILKVFFCTKGHSAFLKLHHYGILGEIVPQVTQLTSLAIDLDPDRGFVGMALKNTDARLVAGKSVTPGFLFSILLWKSVCDENRINLNKGAPAIQSLHVAIRTVISNQKNTIEIPRYVTKTMFDIWDLQRKLTECCPQLIEKTLAHRRFRAAYDFLLLRIRAGEIDPEVGDWWTRIQEHDLKHRKQIIAQLTNSRPKRRRHGRTGHYRRL